MIITIDGPTASGKSTIASLVAEKLGFYYISSGILFRALAYILSCENKYSPDFSNVKESDLSFYSGDRIVYHYCPNAGAQVFFDCNDITPFLKTSVIDRYASLIAVNPHVRKQLLKLQHTIAQKHNVVVEGRDSGSVVFPHADIKFFLTASVRVRARRWKHDQEKHHKKFTLAQAIKHISERDMRDQSRAIAPLIIPPDAIIIDNSDMTLPETLQVIIAAIKKNSGD